MAAPPSADVVIKRGPLVLCALAAPIAGFACCSLFEKVTPEEKEEQAQEAERRIGIVKDMIESLETAENREEEKDESAEGEKDEEVEVEADVDKQEDANCGKSKEFQDSEVDEDEIDDEYDDVGQIEYSTLLDKCWELQEMRPHEDILKRGVDWCGKLLLKEMETAARKTDAQNDVRYADGRKLEKLLNCPLELDRLAKESHHKVQDDLRKNIRTAYLRAYYVHQKQTRNDIVRAIKMICIAWETLPWVFASNGVSTVATTISTMALHYRAEVLQSLKVSQESRAPFYKATRAMIIVELIAGLLKTLEGQLSARVDRVMAKSLQVRLFMALLAKDTVWWGEQKAAYKYSWMVIDLPSDVQNALEIPRVLINAFTSVFIQAALVRAKSSKMLYVMMALHASQYFIRKGIRLAENLFDRLATANLVRVTDDQMTWVQAINPEYVQTFQSFARGPLESKNLIKYTRDMNRYSELTGAVTAVFSPIRSMVSQCGSIVEYLNMAKLVETGTVDLTEAETTLHYASDVSSQIAKTYNRMTRIKDKFSPLARAYDFIAIPTKLDPNVGIDPGKRARGHFVFDNVKFGYPGRKVQVLKGVSFEVKPGQAVGITGASGCGKSTILRLVERFYDVTGGRILLDGRDIREYKPQWLRSQIVVVAQEPKLLPFSIRENLTFGCFRQPSMEDIEQACRAAKIWDTLKDPNKFPNGLETQMSVIQNVAGGEKQRICIARAILADPPILLLDEATSALDEVSQAQVQEALNKLMEGRTTLVVAHRLSTIKESDKIIGMDDGRVVDDGTHKELLAKPDGVPNIWKKLWGQQQEIKGKSEDASEPVEPLSLPTLQRSTSTTQAKFDVLRQAMSTLMKTQDAEQRQESAQQIEQLIAEIEAKMSENGSPYRKESTTPTSKWETVRKYIRFGSALATVRANSPKRAPSQSSLDRQPNLVRSLTLERSSSETSAGLGTPVSNPSVL